MQKALNIILIVAVIVLAIFLFMQYRSINKLIAAVDALTPKNPDGTPKRTAAPGDWIDQLASSASSVKNMKVEVTY